ncbi:uncharacterized protein METZ01_LOCUS250367, partial [marine metagenome]
MKQTQQLAGYFSGFGETGGFLAKVPAAEEPHVAHWRQYRREGDGTGGGFFQALQGKLPQLCIPQREGV